MRSTARTLACLGLVLIALSPARSRAQQPATPSTPAAAAGQTPDRPGDQPPAPADQPAQPVFRSGINFVRVDVIVTGKGGAYVADLKQGDFDVTEDGKPQSIETFKLIKLDGGRASTDEKPRPIRTDADEEIEAARDDVRLFAIFLDDYHVRRNNSVGVREPLTRFIETQLGPSDMIGMMYPLESIKSVRMTRNHDAVMRGIQQFVGRKYDYQPKNDIEARYMYYPTETVERIRVGVSLSALKGLIIHMGGLKEGRKSLIVVSEGFSYMVPPQMRSPNAATGISPGQFDPQAGTNSVAEQRAEFSATADLLQDLRNVYDEANKQNVAIYTVDPRGLTSFEFDASDPSMSMETDRKYLNATMETLRILADESDGRAIVNRNDIAGGMKQIINDSSAYYLLGYNSSQTKPDGKFHDIKVRVKRPGVQVRARKGYWALTQEESARALAPPKPGPPPAVEAALSSATIVSRSRVVRTWIGTSRGENGKTKITLVWEPAPKQPGDRPTPPGEQPARVSVMAIGGDGSPYFRGRVPDVALASANPAAVQGVESATTTRAPSRVVFEARPGKMELRLSVEGSSSQVLDSETRTIVVPDLTSPQASLGTPQVFRARTARDVQQIRGDPQAVPVAGREFSRTDKLMIRVPAYGSPPPTLSAHVLNRAGQPMFEVPATPPTPPSDATLYEVPLAGLAPGDYLFEVKATGEGGDAKELLGFRVTS